MEENTSVILMKLKLLCIIYKTFGLRSIKENAPDVYQACELKEHPAGHVRIRMHQVQTERTWHAGCTFNRVGRYAPVHFLFQKSLMRERRRQDGPIRTGAFSVLCLEEVHVRKYGLVKAIRHCYNERANNLSGT